MKAPFFLLPLICVAVAACDEDPGSFDYSDHVPLGAQTAGVFLRGPTPYIPGVPRLYISPALYEPAGNERIYPLDGRNTFLFVFDTNGDGSGAFTLNPSGFEFSSERVQGEVSLRIIHAGQTFYGLGYFWYQPRDLSQYSTFNVSLKSTSTSTSTFDDITINFESGARFPSVTVGVTVNATEYGYVNDGMWHSLTIPLDDLVERGWDDTSVRLPFGITGDAGDLGDSFLIDDVYYQ